MRNGLMKTMKKKMRKSVTSLEMKNVPFGWMPKNAINLDHVKSCLEMIDKYKSRTGNYDQNNSLGKQKMMMDQRDHVINWMKNYVKSDMMKEVQRLKLPWFKNGRPCHVTEWIHLRTQSLQPEHHC